MKIRVIWHKNPDTDSIVSAILFAEYLNKTWQKAKAHKLWKLNNETKFLLKLLKEKKPKTIEILEAWTKIALVDHNEKSQTIDNIDELDIEYVIDHHKIDFSTEVPINIRMEKLCSTASVIYKMYKEANLEIDTRTAILMLAAIISDSLMFKSPTTTKFDIEIAEKLQKIAKIEDVEKFAMDMFNAKSDLWDISAEKVVKYDYKNFEVNNKNFWIWTLETTNPNYAFWRKDEILEAMKEIKEKEKLDFILFSVVDIIKENNTSFVLNWEDSIIVEEVFGVKVESNEVDLGRRLSRKKQIAPDLTNYFGK